MRVWSLLLLLLPAIAEAAPCDGAQARAARSWAKAATDLEKDASVHATRAKRLKGAARVDGSKDVDIYLDQAALADALAGSLGDAASLARAASDAAKGDPVSAMQAAVTAVATHREISERSWNKARATSEAAFGLCAAPGTPIPGPLARVVEKPVDPTPKPELPADSGPVTPPAVSSWVERPGGLGIADLTEGTGAVAEPGGLVTIDYAGWLQEGLRFDSSYARKQPFKFKLGAAQVIAGMEQGVTGMKVGGKRLIRIPSSLAYGDAAVGPIPGGSTLLFQIELRDVAIPRVPPAAPEPLTEADYSRTPSGLMVHDFVVGTGAAPKAGDTVIVDYTGWLSNGKMFDSSMSREEPFDFRVGIGEVIKGWDEALLGMKTGGRRQVRIPAPLGYGSAGAPPVIPPGATLIFDIRLVEVQPK